MISSYLCNQRSDRETVFTDLSSNSIGPIPPSMKLSVEFILKIPNHPLWSTIPLDRTETDSDKSPTFEGFS